MNAQNHSEGLENYSGSLAELGALLRRAREEQGLEVDKVCEILHIPKDVLRALEEGREEGLPPLPYVRAMLVSLAGLLELDSKDLLGKVSTAPEPGLEVPGESDETPPKAPSPLEKIPIGLLPFFIVGGLLALLVATLVYIRSQWPEKPAAESPIPALDDTLPSPLAPPAGADDDQEDAEAPWPGAEPVDPGEGAQTGGDLPEAGAPTRGKRRVKTQVVLNSLVDSVWVMVERRGARTANRVLHRGQVWKVKHDDTITVTFGVENGLEVEVDGLPYHPSRRRVRVFGKQLLE